MNATEVQNGTQQRRTDEKGLWMSPSPPSVEERSSTKEEDADVCKETLGDDGGGDTNSHCQCLSGQCQDSVGSATSPPFAGLSSAYKSVKQAKTDSGADTAVRFLGGGCVSGFSCWIYADEPACELENGSVTLSHSCDEPGTPPYLKWAQSLRYLLENREGVELFKRYLVQEHCEDSLDFWFACEGLKLQAPDAPDRLHQLIKLIYRKYLRSHNAINISPIIRKAISEHLAFKGPPNQHIFDEAQCEVEESIRSSTYPNFLKSDIYLQYVQVAQNGHDDLSPRCGYGSASLSGCCSVPSSRSSSSGGLADVGGPLATVMEDCELSMANCASNMPSSSLPLTSRHLIATQLFRAGLSDVRRPEALAGMYLHQNPSRTSNPYHALYASFIPGSAQDSELQSLSSDAHTDDTISLTDSSVDGVSVVNSRKYLRQQHRAMRQNASQNRDSFGHNTFIPRTQRLPLEKYPPSDPEKFAAILTQKLEAVLKLQESQEKVNESLRKLEHDESKAFVCRNEESSGHNGLSQQQPLSSVILTAIRDGIVGPDDNVQSILDAHVSRIWDDSCHQSPLNRSPPGRRSPPPRPRSPERRRASAPPIIANSYYKPAYLNAYQHHRHRKDRDLASTFSGDSGAVPDFAESEVPSSAGASGVSSFQHKHGHHHATRTKVSGDIIDLPRTGHVDPYSMSSVDSRRSGLPDKRGSGKKSFMDSSSSGVDSGVSVAYEPDAQALSINSREKVMSWVLESKKYCSAHPSDSDKDYSVRHKKSTYSSMSATSPGANRQGRGKKHGSFISSRSGSLERGGLLSRSSAQPSQPFMSDPSMPILPPPNTTTQLEEARRRLEDDTKAKISKSKSAALNKDRVYHMELSGKNSRQMLTKVPAAGLVADPLDEGVVASLKKSCKKQQPSTPTQAVVPLFSTTSTNTEFTAVAYQFIGEPVPYLTKLPGKNVLLKSFKTLITKKCNFRYFFKQASDEFESGCVYQEITEDNELLPLFEGKIVARLEALE